MNKRKQLLTPEALALVAARFKALSEPLRLRILQELETGELTVSEIVEAVAATQSNISKHLKVLQEVGLLARRQAGNAVYYSIADESVFELCNIICTRVREHLSAQTSALVGETRAEKKNRKSEGVKTKRLVE